MAQERLFPFWIISLIIFHFYFTHLISKNHFIGRFEMLKLLMTKIKTLSLPIIFLAIFTASMGQAAIFNCTHVDEPCDQYGNQYQCSCWGWCGPNSLFCSPTDKSTHRPKANPKLEQNADELDYILEETQAPKPSGNCEDCHQLPRPSSFCRSKCGCASAFCGSW